MGAPIRFRMYDIRIWRVYQLFEPESSAAD